MLDPKQARDPHYLHAYSAIYECTRCKKDKEIIEGQSAAGKQASKQIMMKNGGGGGKGPGLAGRDGDKENVGTQAGRYTGRNASKHYWQPMLSNSFFSQEAFMQRFWFGSMNNSQ